MSESEKEQLQKAHDDMKQKYKSEKQTALEKEQAKMIQKNIKNVSFSKVLNLYLRIGLSNESKKPKMKK